jgi:hypothetical protein
MMIEFLVLSSYLPESPEASCSHGYQILYVRDELTAFLPRILFLTRPCLEVMTGMPLVGSCLAEVTSWDWVS